MSQRAVTGDGVVTKKIIEQDICATCVNVCLLEPPPPTGPWEKKALCTAGWPYTRVFASANAIDECPQYEKVMQPTKPWPFPTTPRQVAPTSGASTVNAAGTPASSEPDEKTSSGVQG